MSLDDSNISPGHDQDLPSIVPLDKKLVLKSVWQAEVDALRLALAASQDEAERAKKNEATCHCGSPMSAHGMGEGHSPVEMPEECPYAAELAALRADKARLDWRPMDHPDVWNVKKTQTRVLLRVPYSQFQNPDTQFSVTIGYWLKASPNDEGFWKNPDWSRFNVPTHWHPLPSADLAAARANPAPAGGK